MDKCIKLADTVVLVEHLSDSLYEKVKKYECSGEPAFCVDMNSLDLEEERNYFVSRNGKESEMIGSELLEFSALLRAIAENLIDYNTMLFHGSAVCMDGQVYLFCADSGTGKSTHARMWRECFGDRVVMINDDKPLIRIDEAGIVCYGSPWSGKHRLDTNTSAPIKAVCILGRDTVNHIEMIDKDMAMQYLLKYSYRSKNPLRIAKSLAMLDQLAKKVPMYALGCNISHEAAVTAYEGMQEDL